MSVGKGPGPEHQINIAMAIILTIVTCGIYGIFWQYKQIEALNAFKGDEEYSFAAWFFLTIITCGIFGIYYEYKMANGINEIKHARGGHVDSNLPLICMLLSIFGLVIVSFAIQQGEINKMTQF